MKDHDSQETRQGSVMRKPWEPPTATFVPVKLEERLCVCLRGWGRNSADRTCCTS